MSNLIDELKADHKQIAEALGKVKQLGVTTPEGQELLRLTKGGLLAHLAKEDKWLYPALWKEAETDESLHRTLELFAGEMENISKAALDFFDKFAKGEHGADFAKDFAVLLATLGQRINKEEHIIYEKFHELETKRAASFTSTLPVKEVEATVTTSTGVKDELDKLRAAVEKLQRENASLKKVGDAK